ncbi:hypothetical protein DID88_008723 [Monilinia fructigena]|uniref:STI1 domain-containing protein n=1 Tax=Monilinia fructigena TaxID=38457 RepID=A0A395JB93_9HELO|nr:hypothetical protein DID88_008723 [Monilinia fructigena]
MADALKAAGNKAIAEKNFDEAVAKSAAYASKRDFENSLKDAEKCTSIKPDWAKGWGRLDANYAVATKGLAQVKKSIDAEAKADGIKGDPTAGLGSMFSDPQLITKSKSNPGNTQELFSDPRMIQVLGVLMGVDMSFADSGAFGGAPGAEGAAAPKEAEEDVQMPDTEPEPEPEDEEAIAKKKAKLEADEEKKLGTEQYKKKNFDEAIAHYTKAWEIFKDITYLNNLGAAYFEKGEYEEAIKACEKAVEEGREIYADFKMIAKSYARIGTSYEKLGDLQRPSKITTSPSLNIVPLRSSTSFVLPKRNKIDSAKKAYIDPAKAEEARELGNQKFKESDWPGAVEAYSEMIKRAPEDPRGYSNRAASFIKLLEFPSALEDCDKAISKDSKFVRAYIRKAQAYFGMRDYSKSLDACNEASEADITKANAREIEQQQQKAVSAMYSARENETEEQTKERLSRDPEIQRIMGDPVMQSILQQAQNDPAALQEHMKNPQIRSKIQQLIAAGVIRVGR